MDVFHQPFFLASGMPNIRPLETLHNSLSLRQLDAFLEYVTQTNFKTPCPTPPGLRSSKSNSDSARKNPMLGQVSRDSSKFFLFCFFDFVTLHNNKKIVQNVPKYLFSTIIVDTFIDRGHAHQVLIIMITYFFSHFYYVHTYNVTECSHFCEIWCL